MTKYNICICGGGNISHALVGKLSYEGHKINVLTRKPLKWNNKIRTFINTPNDKYDIESKINKVSENPAITLDNVDIVIITCPLMAINNILTKIKPYLRPNMILISIPGRLFINFIEKNNIKNKLITILRTPYICTIKEYGNSVYISGFIHDKINYWSNCDIASDILNNLFKFKNNRLLNSLSIDLVNSNLILHSSRLFVLFYENKSYNEIPKFYSEWCIESSKMLIVCDKELHNLIDKINENIKNKIYVKDILSHYQSNDEISLTNKIKSIKSLPDRSTVIKKNNKYYADINNRYFQEEIIALEFVLQLAKKYNVNIPNLKKIYNLFLSL
jgi:hypothetical protein